MDVSDLIIWLKVNASTAIDPDGILLQAGDIIQAAYEYHTMSDEEMLSECGEVNSRDIRAVRSVLNAVLAGNFYPKMSKVSSRRERL